MIAFAGPDSLRIEASAVEVPHLYSIGSIPGVIPLLASASNGPGSGLLSSSSDGKTLHWRAPGSLLSGIGVRCATDGNYLLHDGDDRNKWLRVQVDVSEMEGGGRGVGVALTDIYNNPVGSDDITSGQAAAGNVETYTLTLENQSNSTLSQLTVWIDSSVTGIEIADDGATWVSPKSETTGLILPDLVPGGTDTLHIRRTITAGAIADGHVLTYLHTKYRG